MQTLHHAIVRHQVHTVGLVIDESSDWLPTRHACDCGAVLRIKYDERLQIIDAVNTILADGGELHDVRRLPSTMTRSSIDTMQRRLARCDENPVTNRRGRPHNRKAR